MELDRGPLSMALYQYYNADILEIPNRLESQWKHMLMMPS
jgi:hypothetical protein